MSMAVCSSAMSFLFVILMGFLCLSHAQNRTLYVGGDDGWTLKPSESYGHWAQRHRFLINDELVFRYKKAHDSVLVVSEHDYYKCNKDSPIKTIKNGDSKFKLDRSGPFFFISGHDQNCEKGQKLIVVVISKYHHNHHNPPPQPPKTAFQPPSSSPSPTKPPSYSPSHAPPVQPPSHSPSPSIQKEAIVPSDHYSLPPHAHYPVFLPHHAPAPAPSSASDFNGSFVLIVGLSLLASMISSSFI